MQTHDSESSAVDAALRRGIAAARAGLRSVAAAQFERAAEQSPDDPDVWLWLAWVANSPDNTTRCLERVLELSPGHAAAITGLAWARALAHKTPIEPIMAAVAAGDFECVAVVESEIKTESPQESLTAASGLVCETPETDIALETPVESIWSVAASQQQDFAEAISVTEPVDVSAEASPETISGPSADSPPEDSSRRRWSEFVRRGPDSLTDAAAWPGAVPPPLPNLVPPPLPIVAANTQVEPHPFARSRFYETSAANPAADTARVSDPGLVPETSTDIESLAKSFNPPTLDVSADGRPLVMVVDDSPTVRKLVALTLERRGYRVISAFDGVAAIKELGSCRPDLILLDINMPRLDGYRLCKLIKKHEATHTIPVVMLSGKDGMFDKLRGRLVGCSDYITKPFEADDLTLKVAKYLTTAATSS